MNSTQIEDLLFEIIRTNYGAAPERRLFETNAAIDRAIDALVAVPKYQDRLKAAMSGQSLIRKRS